MRESLSNSAYRFFDNWLPLARGLLRPACLLCAGYGTTDGLCHGCRLSLPRLPAPRCTICAAPGAGAEVCGRCLSRRPAFDHVVAALDYAFPADALVRSMKYRGGLACARALAAVLADALDSEPYPDLVMPMPLAPQRLRQRGFNQAMEIARLIGAEFGLRITANGCRRSRESAPQASLPWKQRAANVRNAFVCELDLEGKSVAVVDDVLTTGATLNELAATLKSRGAREVWGWIVARTLPRR